MEPSKGGTQQTERAKSQPSDSQGATGPSGSRPSSQGTYETYHEVIKKVKSVFTPRCVFLAPAHNSDFGSAKQLEELLLPR